MTRSLNRLAAICLVTMSAAQASASLVGLRVFREGLYGFPDPPPNESRWIYRVYAEFTEPTDYLTSWGIGLSLGPGQIRNISAAGTPGTGFINIPDNDTGNLAPLHPLTPRDWDTYMTIGVVYGEVAPMGVDATQFGPGTPTFITNGSPLWTAQLGYVSLFSPFTQGRGDYWVSGNDTNLRVLMMQLVVNAGEHVDGTLGVIWRNQATGFVATGLSFSSIPEPGAVLALLPLASILRKRR